MVSTAAIDLDKLLQERMPGFTPRPAQQGMTELVSTAITEQQNALIEAGTGTGKTFAYLLPVLSSGKKVIISTGTKNLQDQLFNHDLPFINESFGRTTALLKGRSNYVCHERLEQQISTRGYRLDDTLLEKLVSIYQWSEHSRAGDLTELLDEEDLDQVQALVTSTAENCLGQQCSKIAKCAVYQARARALEADVVVVNHHLLFSDLALKEQELGELLPSADIVVIDEAHQVESTARHFYGERFSSRQLVALARDVVREQQLIGLDDPELITSAEWLTHAISLLVESVVDNNVTSIQSLTRFDDDIETVDIALADVISRLQHAGGRSVGLARCYTRACRINDLFAVLTQSTYSDESAHWVEPHARSFTIHLLPLDVAKQFGPLLNDGARTWVFVSATLTSTAKFLSGEVRSDDPKPFKLIKDALGFEAGLIARFASPFDYAQQTAGFVPPDMPEPGQSDFTDQLVRRVLPLIRIHDGRSLLLFTSHQALARAAQLLGQEYDLIVMVQGAMSKSKLLLRYRDTPGAILLATHSFWEGVDLSGTKLRLLVIDKLPFTSPDDPVFQARLNRLDRLGGNGFMEGALPQAAVTLKQGFGRLIRQEHDRGLFVLGDPRFLTKSYGQILKSSLPAMNWLEDSTEAINYLTELAS